MAYSFVPVGSSGAEYDTIAETVAEKVHFAGEVMTVTNTVLVPSEQRILKVKNNSGFMKPLRLTKAGLSDY